MTTATTLYHNITDIFADIDGARDDIYRQTEKLSPAQARFKSAADRWSVVEILEHLAKAERWMVKFVREALHQREAPGDSGSTPVKFVPFSMNSYDDAARDRRFVTPDFAAPAGDLPLHDVLERLRGSRAELHSLRPRIEVHDLSQIAFAHPAFGSLNLYQWLAFAAIHERRHLRQIESVISAPGFPKS